MTSVPDAANAGDQQGHDADGAWPLDHHQISGLHCRLFHQGIVGYADWLGERGVFIGHVLRHPVQDRRAGFHIASHRTVGQRAVAQTVGTEIVVAAQAVDANRADLRGGLHRHAVSYPPIGDVVAHIDNDTGKFVAQHERQPHLPGLLIAPHMHIRAAHAGGLDLHQHLLRPDLRFRHVPHLHFLIAVSEFGNRFHWTDSLCFVLNSSRSNASHGR